MKAIIITLKFMVSLVFSLASFFLYNCDSGPNTEDSCDCKLYTGFTENEFPYSGTHEINYFIIANGNSKLVEKPDDYHGDFTVVMGNGKDFNIDCNISLDTLDINFYLDGTFTFYHTCGWQNYQGANRGTCDINGNGVLDIENSTITNLQGQNIEFSYGLLDAWIILTLDNMTDQIKIPLNQ